MKPNLQSIIKGLPKGYTIIRFDIIINSFRHRYLVEIDNKTWKLNNTKFNRKFVLQHIKKYIKLGRLYQCIYFYNYPFNSKGIRNNPKYVLYGSMKIGEYIP